MRMLTSAHAGPMLRINCPIFQPLALPSTPRFSPTPPHIGSSTSTADINMPGSSSVGHSSDRSVSDLDYMLEYAVLDPKSED
jgi:hypothetical protein